MRPLVAAVMGGGQGAVMAKAALHLQGLIESPAVRLPLVEASPAEVAVLQAVLREHALIPA
jgi:4-hydroxy-tetrahydrodipicolinate synthase